jgi:hypothetical protein
MLKLPYSAGTTGISNGKCPLCGYCDDSPGHILLACPSHKPMHINRHDLVGRTIIRYIRQGKLGGYHLIADVGAKDKLAELDVHDKRVQAWVLGDTETATTTTKPDIIVLHIPQQSRIPATPLAIGTKVTLVEVGFRNDFDVDGNKLQEKLKQHSQLQETLIQRGFKVDYQVWDIGYTGIMSRRLRTHAVDLGIDKVDSLLQEIHSIAVQQALAVMNARRLQEKTTINGTTNSTATNPPQPP